MNDDALLNPLDSFPPPTLSLVGTTRVPNVFPEHDNENYRLAVVGEAPGADEEASRYPFIGASGKLLDKLLGASGVERKTCFVGNVCKYRPPGNDITEWGFDHPRVVEGWLELQSELAQFQPNCILALGNTPLHFLAGRSGISSWRGSILSTPYGKLVPSIHPAAVLREYNQWPLLSFDIRRAMVEAGSKELSLPNRTLELHLSADEICNRLDNWPAGKLLSFDIEGGLDAFPCCSVASESNSGFIIAWSKHSEAEQGRIAVALSRALYSSSVPKVLQNSLYDRFVLAYGYRMLIRNVREDTMLKQWELYPELSKGLATICSIFTREPYYKFEGKKGNKFGLPTEFSEQETYYRYCIKDSCVTLEAALAMDNALSLPARRHYNLNIDLLSPLLYMELRGFAYDKETAERELGQVRLALSETRARLEQKILPTQWTKTEFSTSLCGAKGSISSQRLVRVLYEHRGYPVQKDKPGPSGKPTGDVNALLKILKKKEFSNDPFIHDVLLHRKLESIAETLEVATDPDGRIRCGYNLVGTETGRLTCYTSPTGSGANLQTITKKLRKLYRADEGMWLFQCDLAGADGWTVAAHCLRHGDPTMWDDYHFGLKPARIVALMYSGRDVQKMTREEIKLASREVDDDGWLYFACKRVQHSTNYGVQAKTGADQVMKDSYKMTGRAIYMEPEVFAQLQRLYLVRYPGLFRWHDWAAEQVKSGKNLTGSSGHERKFFGRRVSYDQKKKGFYADHDTWKEFLADEPQSNTTYATNLALYNLWTDQENRNKRKRRLVIEPLHQVHDALIGQFPKELTDWAIPKIRQYFSNELVIAGVTLTIPFDGAYGPSWGELGPKYGGGSI